MPLADERRKDCTTMCQRRGNAVGIPVSPEAQATKQVSVEGEDLEAFEILLYLDVVALKGSVPPQWVEDFQQVCTEQIHRLLTHPYVPE